jgi:hypothetical protein
VLGTLLVAGEPMTVQEIVAALATAGFTTNRMLVKSPAGVIANLLAHQVSIGKVRKVARATYGVVPSSMSASTRSRCRRWRDGLTG